MRYKFNRKTNLIRQLASRGFPADLEMINIVKGLIDYKGEYHFFKEQLPETRCQLINYRTGGYIECWRDRGKMCYGLYYPGKVRPKRFYEMNISRREFLDLVNYWIQGEREKVYNSNWIDSIC